MTPVYVNASITIYDDVSGEVSGARFVDRALSPPLASPQASGRISGG
jgi:hypothetical protein